MDIQPTYDDVNLILRLYELRREQKMREARDWFATNLKANNLDELAALCPPGSKESAYFRMVISYWEMVASFITSGVLNQEVFFQSGGELLFVWERFKGLVPLTREAYKNPTLYLNLETVANAFIKRMNKQAPEAYVAYAARIKGM
jgi:hypothetical protein